MRRASYTIIIGLHAISMLADKLSRFAVTLSAPKSSATLRGGRFRFFHYRLIGATCIAAFLMRRASTSIPLLLPSPKGQLLFMS